MLTLQMWGMWLGHPVQIDEGNRITKGVLTGITQCSGEKGTFSLWVDYDYELYPEQCKPIVRDLFSIKWEERELLSKKYKFTNRKDVDDFFYDLKDYAYPDYVFELVDMGLDYFNWVASGCAVGGDKTNADNK